MKKILSLVLLLATFSAINAQEVDYKKGLIKVDGADYAKMEVKKENFGLTKNFQVFSLTGEKIMIGAVATEFDKDYNDNTFLYYRVTFLTVAQEGIFKIPSLDKEKAFAKLIGQSGILVNGAVDEKKVLEFIALRGSTPRIAQ
ncbi:MAG: hypothetical protein V4556_01990 [Bacteroidota bacterium]